MSQDSPVAKRQKLSVDSDNASDSKYIKEEEVDIPSQEEKDAPSSNFEMPTTSLAPGSSSDGKPSRRVTFKSEGDDEQDDEEAIQFDLAALTRQYLQQLNAPKGKKLNQATPPQDSGEDEDQDSLIVKRIRQARTTQETSYFDQDTEELLAEFFSMHPEFYDKANKGYYSKDHKTLLLADLAQELNTTAQKIEGWFRNQRTTFGRLIKGASKSGTGGMKRTPRQEWQLRAFQFLSEHINPRTYTKESTSTTTQEQFAEVHPMLWQEENVATPQGKQQFRNVTTTKDSPQLLQKFKERPQAVDAIARQMASDKDPKSIRQGYADFMAGIIHQMPEDRWASFARDSFQLAMKYMYGPAAPPTPQSS